MASRGARTDPGARPLPNDPERQGNVWHRVEQLQAQVAALEAHNRRLVEERARANVGSRREERAEPGFAVAGHGAHAPASPFAPSGQQQAAAASDAAATAASPPAAIATSPPAAGRATPPPAEATASPPPAASSTSPPPSAPVAAKPSPQSSLSCAVADVAALHTTLARLEAENAALTASKDAVDARAKELLAECQRLWRAGDRAAGRAAEARDHQLPAPGRGRARALAAWFMRAAGDGSAAAGPPPVAEVVTVAPPRGKAGAAADTSADAAPGPDAAIASRLARMEADLLAARQAEEKAKAAAVAAAADAETARAASAALVHENAELQDAVLHAASTAHTDDGAAAREAAQAAERAAATAAENARLASALRTLRDRAPQVEAAGALLERMRLDLERARAENRRLAGLCGEAADDGRRVDGGEGPGAEGSGAAADVAAMDAEAVAVIKLTSSWRDSNATLPPPDGARLGSAAAAPPGADASSPALPRVPSAGPQDATTAILSAELRRAQTEAAGLRTELKAGGGRGRGGASDGVLARLLSRRLSSKPSLGISSTAGTPAAADAAAAALRAEVDKLTASNARLMHVNARLARKAGDARAAVCTTKAATRLGALVRDLDAENEVLLRECDAAEGVAARVAAGCLIDAALGGEWEGEEGRGKGLAARSPAARTPPPPELAARVVDAGAAARRTRAARRTALATRAAAELAALEATLSTPVEGTGPLPEASALAPPAASPPLRDPGDPLPPPTFGPGGLVSGLTPGARRAMSRGGLAAGSLPAEAAWLSSGDEPGAVGRTPPRTPRALTAA